MILSSISATSYNLYKQCPYQWKLKYKLNLLQGENKAFKIGSAVHKGLEMFHIGFSEEQIYNVAKDTMLNGEETSPEDIKNYSMVRRMIEAYIRNPIIDETIAVEHRFKIGVLGLVTPLTGFVDRITTSGIVEYKTSAKDYTLDDIDNIQTDIYSYAYVNSKFYSGKMPMVTYCVLNKQKSKKNNYIPQNLSITRTKRDMEKLVSDLARFEFNVKKDNFGATPGQHCYSRCSFSDSCKYR